MLVRDKPNVRWETRNQNPVLFYKLQNSHREGGGGLIVTMTLGGRINFYTYSVFSTEVTYLQFLLAMAGKKTGCSPIASNSIFFGEGEI